MTSFLWLVLEWLHNGVRCRSLTTRAHEELPSFHLREMWLPELVDRELLFVDIGVLLGRRRFRLPVCCGAFFYLEEVQGANKISKWLSLDNFDNFWNSFAQLRASRQVVFVMCVCVVVQYLYEFMP